MNNLTEPEYVYEDAPPEVWEIQCPLFDSKIPSFAQFACAEWMNRDELTKHMRHFHYQEYEVRDNPDVEVFFENERERRYGR